uniref:Uncharacterized protein n=1 Tax=Tanacetum cinerariifolium TaxID=118510 RepID=A0A6L2MI59_TANCI|nr:hypothetical protein [Tanacetum cinerariifolium]
MDAPPPSSWTKLWIEGVVVLQVFHLMFKGRSEMYNKEKENEGMEGRGTIGITCSVTREEYTEFLDQFLIPSCYSPFFLILIALLLTFHQAICTAIPEENHNENVVGSFERGVVARPPSRGVAPTATLVGSSSKGKVVVGSSYRGLKRGRFGDSSDGSSSPILVGFIGPLDTSKKDPDYDPFLPGLIIQRSRCDWMETCSSSLEVLKLHDVVFMLKGDQLGSFTTIARLEAKLLYVVDKSPVDEPIAICDLMAENERLKKDTAGLQELSQLFGSSKEVLEVDVEAFRSRCRKFEVLLSSDSFSTLLADLQKKDMLVRRAQAFEEVADMGLGFQFKDVKDYDLNVVEACDKAVEAFDKGVDDFYRVDFPYLDLLAYLAKKELGFA